MAASFDQAAENSVLEGTYIMVSPTISASATLLVALIAYKETTPSPNGLVLDTVVAGGTTSLTFQSQITNGYTLDVWYLASPPTGATFVEFTWNDAITGLPAASGGVCADAACVTFISTDTSFPIVRNTTRTDRREQRQIISRGFVPPSVTDAVTTIQAANAANFLVDGCVINVQSVTPTLTVDPAQTQRWSVGWTGADTFNVAYSGSTRASAVAKIPMRWDTNTFAAWAQSVVEVKGV